MTRRRRHPVLGVVGGSGGVGASRFAAALAVLAGPALLVDLDVAGGGIDVALGLEHAPGARWSGLRVAGGHLDPETLLAGLPRTGGCGVLAADVAELDPGAVGQVIDTAAPAVPVIADLPRASCAERGAALVRCDLVVVLARADVSGLVAAHAAVSALPQALSGSGRELPELPIGLVVRRGEVPAAEAADLVGAQLLGVLPAMPAAGSGWDATRLPRAVVRVVDGVLAGLGGSGTPTSHRRPAGALVRTAPVPA